MKKYTLQNIKELEKPPDSHIFESLVAKGDEDMTVSDGNHTMDELYDHRIELYITLCRFVVMEDDSARSFGGVDRNSRVWRSQIHADGSIFEGWFILGIGKEADSQVSYHLPISRWGDTGFAETLGIAPEWDGHTPGDVLERLKKL